VLTEDVLKPKKRLGRMRRSKRLGIIVPVEGGKIASKGKGETGEFKE